MPDQAPKLPVSRRTTRPVAASPAPALATLALGTLLLGGCSNTDLSRTFGFSRDAPDEYTVTTQVPLSMSKPYALGHCSGMVPMQWPK